MKLVLTKNEFGKGVVVQEVMTFPELAKFVSEQTSAVDKPIDYNDVFELTEFVIDMGYDIEFKEESINE